MSPARPFEAVRLPLCREAESPERRSNTIPLMNPARRLHNTILLWREKHTTGAHSVAGPRALDSQGGMERQLDALDDLRHVEAGLDELEGQGVRVIVWRRYVADWRQLVLGYPNGWMNQADPHMVYNAAAIDQLDTLADRFDERMPSLTDQQKASLEDIVVVASKLLQEDDSLSAPLKLYLGRILTEIQNAALDERLAERFDYATAARRLWVTLMAAAEESTDEGRKTGWRNAAKRFAWDTGVAIAASAPGLLLGITGLT